MQQLASSLQNLTDKYLPIYQTVANILPPNKNQTQSNSRQKRIFCLPFLQNHGLQDKNKFFVV